MSLTGVVLSAARTEQRDGRIHGRLDDVPDGPAVFDGQRGQFPQTAHQDHGQRRRSAAAGRPAGIPGWR